MTTYEAIAWEIDMTNWLDDLKSWIELIARETDAERRAFYQRTFVRCLNQFRTEVLRMPSFFDANTDPTSVMDMTFFGSDVVSSVVNATAQRERLEDNDEEIRDDMTETHNNMGDADERSV
jgi:hypothetical protein